MQNSLIQNNLNYIIRKTSQTKQLIQDAERELGDAPSDFRTEVMNVLVSMNQGLTQFEKSVQKVSDCTEQTDIL